MLEGLTKYLDKMSNLDELDAWNYALSGRKVNNEIVKMIHEQLDNGKGADSKILGYYSFKTQEITGGRKQAGTPYNLDDTGYFRSTIYPLRYDDHIAIQAQTKKMNVDLIDKFSVAIIELNPTNTLKLAGILKVEYLNYLQNVLQNH